MDSVWCNKMRHEFIDRSKNTTLDVGVDDRGGIIYLQAEWNLNVPKKGDFIGFERPIVVAQIDSPSEDVVPDENDDNDTVWKINTDKCDKEGISTEGLNNNFEVYWKIPDRSTPFKFFVLPNPNSDEVNLEFTGEEDDARKEEIQQAVNAYLSGNAESSQITIQVKGVSAAYKVIGVKKKRKSSNELLVTLDPPLTYADRRWIEGEKKVNLVHMEEFAYKYLTPRRSFQRLMIPASLGGIYGKLELMGDDGGPNKASIIRRIVTAAETSRLDWPDNTFDDGGNDGSASDDDSPSLSASPSPSASASASANSSPSATSSTNSGASA